MKRSRSLSLLLMGSLLIGAQGCSNQPSTPDEEVFRAFTSLSECTTSGLFTEAECKDFAITAIKEVPQFTSKEECEASFGSDMCNGPVAQNSPAANGTVSGESTVQQGSGSMWHPMLMGFMAGRLLSGANVMQGSQPLYKDPNAQANTRSFRTAGGETVTPDAKGRVSKPGPLLKQSLQHVAKPAQGRSASSSKGGLGGTSRSGSTGS